MKRTTIRSSQGGYIVYFDNNPEDFYVFKSNEPERLVKFLCEKAIGIKLDRMLEYRQEEITLAANRLAEGQR